MLLRLLLLFTVVPLVELALLLWLGTVIGGWSTFGLVLATGFLGATLARHEGLRCLRRIQEDLAAGRLPGDPLVDGLMILVAGALLVTPGVLTDLVGFALLLPMFRRVVKRSLKNRFQHRIRVTTGRAGWPQTADQPPPHDEIIDARVVDVSPEEPRKEG